MDDLGSARRISEQIVSGPTRFEDFYVYLSTVSNLLGILHKYLLTNSRHSVENLDDIREILINIYQSLQSVLTTGTPIQFSLYKWKSFYREINNNLLSTKFTVLLVEKLDLYSDLLSQKYGPNLRQAKTLKQADEDGRILLQRKREVLDGFREFKDGFDKALRLLVR